MSEFPRAPRYQTEFKLIFDDGSSFSAGRVRDVSESGLFLETAEPSAVGSEVSLFPMDESDDMFEIRAEVVRVQPEDADRSFLGGMAVRFSEPAAVGPHVRALIELLQERQRREVLDPILGVPRPAIRRMHVRGGDPMVTLTA